MWDNINFDIESVDASINSSSSSNVLGNRHVALAQTQQQYNTLAKNTFETKQNSSSWDSHMRLPNWKSFKNKICKVTYSSSIVIRHELYKFMHIWSFKIIFRYTCTSFSAVYIIDKYKQSDIHPQYHHITDTSFHWQESGVLYAIDHFQWLAYDYLSVVYLGQFSIFSI